MSDYCCDKKKRLRRYILFGVGGFVVAILLVIFLFWAVTKPSKPSFTLRSATVNSLNLSSSNSQTNLRYAIMQITIASTNQMDKIGLYYNNLEVYATYRDQQIALPTLLPDTYLGLRETAVWSPFLKANPVSVSPYVAEAFSEDQNAGAILLNIKVEGRVKFKIGSYVTRKYYLNVNCQAYVASGEKGQAIAAGATMTLQSEKSCYVDV